MANNYISDYVGALATVYASNYSDLKMLPVMNGLKNSAIVKVIAIAAGIFYTSGKGNYFSQGLRGAGTWAIGSMLEPYIANHIQNTLYATKPATFVPITPGTQQVTVGTPVVTQR
jgi:hypothetical protein